MFYFLYILRCQESSFLLCTVSDPFYSRTFVITLNNVQFIVHDGEIFVHFLMSNKVSVVK